MIPKMPDIAILDADIIAYKAACWAESSGSEPEFLDRLRADMNYWTPPGLSRTILAFSCSRDDNYRKDYWPSYKENRSGKPKPKYLSVMKEMLCQLAEKEFDSRVVTKPRLEADDLIGIGMSSYTMVGVSLDKDLRSCPGWYWNPDKIDFPIFITDEYADRWFHKQWLMGDSTDHIPGIPKVGPVKADKLLDKEKPFNWTALVMAEYEKKGLDLDYCLAQARCVRILRDGEWDRETETHIPWSPDWALTPESKRD